MNPSKILCIGRNYARHAAELSNPVPTEPLIFLKPPSAIIPTGGEVVIPKKSTEVHHEVELVVRIGKEGKDIGRDQAAHYVDGYAVGIDLTARDVQSKAKRQGHPWSVSKGYDTFAPLGAFYSTDETGDPHSLDLSLRVNESIRQSGNTRDMIFDIWYLIEYLSSIFTLVPGDLIFTGTPEGVGQIFSGDKLSARISGLPALDVTVQ